LSPELADDSLDHSAKFDIEEVSFELLHCALLGFFHQPNEASRLSEETPFIDTILWVFNNTPAQPGGIFEAITSGHVHQYDANNLFRFTKLCKFLCNHGHLDVWTCQLKAQELSEIYLDVARIPGEELGTDKAIDTFNDWLRFAVHVGINIPMVGGDRGRRMNEADKTTEKLRHFKGIQKATWARLDQLKQGGTLEAIVESFGDSNEALSIRDMNGLLSIHVAAVHDRIDVVCWLVDSKGVSLAEMDGNGRTVLQAAVASNASAAIEWIQERLSREKLATFVSSHFCKRRAQNYRKVMQRLTLTIQAYHRGSMVRRKYRYILERRLEESKGF
jgi:Ankyrin repeats (many copies)